MKKYVVTVSALFIGGVKYRRGDIVELVNGEIYGTNLDPVFVPEVVEEKPKPARKPRAKKVVA
jgi:hypothetical protein